MHYSWHENPKEIMTQKCYDVLKNAILSAIANDKIRRSLALTYGVHAIKGEFETTTDEVLDEAIKVSTEAYNLEKDEIAVIMCNMPLTDTKTRVNMMKIHTIE